MDAAALRAHIRQLRKLMPPETLRRESARVCDQLLALPEYAAARVIFAYLAMPGEADLADFIRCARLDGKTVCVPICIGRGEMLAGRLEGRLVRNQFGGLQPSEKECRVIPPGEIDLAIIPALAFDLRCNRMGQGGGYYDRYLAACAPELPKVGVGLDFQLVERLAAQPWDVPMDRVVTPRGQCVRAKPPGERENVSML